MLLIWLTPGQAQPGSIEETTITKSDKPVTDRDDVNITLGRKTERQNTSNADATDEDGSTAAKARPRGPGRPFRKGESGNRRGRPPRLSPTIDFRQITLAELRRMITMPGTRGKVPAIQAVVRATIASAAKGNSRSQQIILDIYRSTSREFEVIRQSLNATREQHGFSPDEAMEVFREMGIELPTNITDTVRILVAVRKKRKQEAENEEELQTRRLNSDRRRAVKAAKAAQVKEPDGKRVVSKGPSDGEDSKPQPLAKDEKEGLHVHGAAERTYPFTMHPLDAAFLNHGAVYILTERRVTPDGRATHQVLSIGQTPDLSKSPTISSRRVQLGKHQANCICVHPEADGDRRQVIEEELRTRHLPDGDDHAKMPVE